MTESESSLPADQILSKIFEVVLEEARQRPEFAQKLVNALPRGAIAEIHKPERSRKTRVGFDPNAFSLVAVLQTEGSAGLKRRLNPIKRKQDLRSLAEAQHVPVDRDTFYNNKTKLPELKDELIRATEARLADRVAAAS
jgi:hypothetical protein